MCIVSVEQHVQIVLGHHTHFSPLEMPSRPRIWFLYWKKPTSMSTPSSCNWQNKQRECLAEVSVTIPHSAYNIGLTPWKHLKDSSGLQQGLEKLLFRVPQNRTWYCKFIIHVVTNQRFAYLALKKMSVFCTFRLSEINSNLFTFLFKYKIPYSSFRNNSK